MDLKEKIGKIEGPIFIFGGSGFIGANLFAEILKYRKDCYAISHNIRNAWRLKLLNTLKENILYCDITYKRSVGKLFEKYRPKTIFNLSAYGGYSKQQDTSLIFQTNLIGTLNILESCRDIKMFINAGSSSEYGENCTQPSVEGPFEPNSFYSVSKLSTSYLIDYYAKYKKIPCVNLRLYSIYGRWEEPDRLFPKLIENARKAKYPQLVNPEISRDFVHIDDCLNAFFCAANNVDEKNYGKSVNIASGIRTTIKELTGYIAEIFNISEPAKFGSMQNRNWDLSDWYGEVESAKQILNWEVKISLKQGIKDTMNWQNSVGYKKVLDCFTQPKKTLKISPIIACYKDEQAILIMYERLVKTFKKIGCNYEIVFVNDCSPDNTQRVLDKICVDDLNVVAITHSRNFGSQASFLSGMGIASGDAVVLMDGDLQDPPEIIEKFHSKWLEGNDVVYGVRKKREASFFMNIFYKMFYRIFKSLAYIKIPVDAGDFSLIDRKVVNEILNLPEKEQFLRGLRAWVGFKQIGVSYFRPERMFGKSTNNMIKNVQWAKKGIFSFSFAPLEMLTFLGVLLTGVSFLAILYQVVASFLFPNIPHGVPTIIVLILFFGGINLFAVSLIGEYIIKIFQEAKGRPVFIRSQVIHRGRRVEDREEIGSFGVKK